MDTISLWLNDEEKSFFLYKNIDDKHPLLLYPGICITWEGRDEYVKIVDVLGKESEKGPRGFTYLPWRKEGRWATQHVTLRGDSRFIVCYPSGTIHYGLHIPLDTIEVYEAPPEYRMKADVSYDYTGAMIQLQHDIKVACRELGMDCVEHDFVFTCSKRGLDFAIHVFKTDYGYRLDLVYRGGSKEEFDLYAEVFLF